MALMLWMGMGAATAQEGCAGHNGGCAGHNGTEKQCAGHNGGCAGHNGAEKQCAGHNGGCAGHNGAEKQCAMHDGAEKGCCKQKQNAAIENIMTRTSIRKFTDQPVEAEKVEQMLRAAMAAPTAVNKQPWHFVVVDSKEVLNRLGGEGRRGDMLRNAPLAIVICGNMDKALDGPGRDFWVQDVSAATENLLLAAHALGLGAVWTGAYPITERAGQIAQILGMPETIIPLCIVVCGYPAESPTPKDKWKPENVSYNAFGAQR